MDIKSEKVLNEAIQIEKNLSVLYFFYSENFVDDSEFWQQMSKEEAEHAALLGLGKDFPDKFPEFITYDEYNELVKVRQEIEDTIKRYERQLPSKKEAYSYALGLETSAYELHYQKLSSSKENSEMMKTFQKLNAFDKDHAKRIEELLTSI